MQRYLPFWGLLVSIFTLLCGINYVRYGMFTDGILYAAIAKNMAMGQGTFWFPVFSETSGTFIGHPALHFFLESLYFRVLGDGYLTERLYCLTSVLLLSYIMHCVWQQYLPKYRAYSFVPLLFFFLIEDVSLTYTSNLLECTLSLFTTASFLCVIPILQNKNNNRIVAFMSFIAALCAAFLSKGPVGLFPLSIFGIAYLVSKTPNFKNALVWTLSTIAALTAIFIILLQFDAPFQSLSAYWDEQIMGSVNAVAATGVEGEANMRGNRLHILKRWFDKMLPILIATALIMGGAWRKKISLLGSETAKRSAILLLLALAGTLPYTLISKQASYYLVPAYVFWALGFGAFIVPEVARLVESINVKSLAFKFFQAVVAVSLVTVFAYLFTQIGETDRRDRKLLSDVRKIGELVPTGTIIFTKNDRPQYSLYHFLERDYDISVDNEQGSHAYVLTDKGMKLEGNCKAIDMSLDLFVMYKCE